jgi:ABC-type bacteriocin/lantibiotic exporter with double-glycine peptidase domain
MYISYIILLFYYFIIFYYLDEVILTTIIMSNEWSIHFWYVIEHIINETNISTLDNAKNAIMLIINFIPCQKCKNHSLEYISNHQFDENSAKLWLIEFKNSINKPINKPINKGSCTGCGKIKSSIKIKSSGYFKSGF